MGNQGVKKKTRFQKIWKKKSFWIILTVAIIFIIGIIFLIVAKNGQKQKNGQQTVKSEIVEKGNISTSIEGSGYLEAADTTSVDVPIGITVKEILVANGDSVKKGQKLAKVSKSSVAARIVEIEDEIEEIEEQLSDSSSSYETASLKAQKKEAEKVLKTLKSLYSSPYIKATKAGVVSTVGVSENSDTSKTSASQSNDTESGNSTAARMSTKSGSGNSVSAVNLSTLKTVKITSEKAVTLNDTNTTSEKSIKLSDTSDQKISDFKNLKITKPETGKTPQSVVEECNYYSGNITWDCNGKFQGGTVYTATVVLMAKDGYVFDSSSLPTIEGANIESGVYNAGKTMILKAKFEATKEDNTQKAPDKEQETNKGDSEKNQGNKSTEGNVPATKADENNASFSSKSSSGRNNVSADSGNSGVINSSSTSVAANSSSQTSSTSTTNSQYLTSAFGIAPNNKAKVSLSVDELDISSVKNGQTAKITLDAIEDKDFEGKITKVSNMGTVSSGSTKNTVEITMDMTDDMKIGMTASATINISQATDVLKISMRALQQMGDETFVYTSADEDGNLSGEVTVETGESDGTNVEIKSGLNEGDTVYYTRNTSGSENGEREFGNMNFGQGNMPNNNGMKGNFQDRGEMPRGERNPD